MVHSLEHESKRRATMEPTTALTSAVTTSPGFSGSTPTCGAVTPGPMTTLLVSLGSLMIISSVATVGSTGSTGSTTVGSIIITGRSGSSIGQEDTTGAHATPVSHSSLVTIGAAPPRKLYVIFCLEPIPQSVLHG